MVFRRGETYVTDLESVGRGRIVVLIKGIGADLHQSLNKSSSLFVVYEKYVVRQI